MVLNCLPCIQGVQLSYFKASNKNNVIDFLNQLSIFYYLLEFMHCLTNTLNGVFSNIVHFMQQVNLF